MLFLFSETYILSLLSFGCKIQLIEEMFANLMPLFCAFISTTGLEISVKMDFFKEKKHVKWAHFELHEEIL